MIKTNPMSVEAIRLLAKKIRNEWNIREDECFPIFDILLYLHDNRMLTLQVLDNNSSILDSNTPALYNAIDNFIYIKESVLEDYENNEYRANFTLAHEFFHYIQTCILKNDFENVEVCKTYENIDWQADEFAGEILLPRDYLSLPDDVLSNRFKVSIECVLTRKVKSKKRLATKEASHK